MVLVQQEINKMTENIDPNVVIEAVARSTAGLEYLILIPFTLFFIVSIPACIYFYFKHKSEENE